MYGRRMLIVLSDRPRLWTASEGACALSGATYADYRRRIAGRIAALLGEI
ncbi:hypothetical protein L598_000400001450 [Mesorhizobium sp. J18]|nr:hypothetical protein L598_000400001450 [Mesorhizobium sp. J18]